MRKSIFLLIALSLSGCGGDSLLDAANAYMHDDTNQNKSQLIIEIDKVNDSFISSFSDVEIKSIKQSLKTALERNDYDYSELLIRRIDNSTGIKFFGEDVVEETVNFERLSQDTTLKNAYFIKATGIYYADKHHFKSAYYNFVKAAEIDNNYVGYVKYLLGHFGCNQNLQVWNGLVDGNASYSDAWGLHLPGEQYPDLPLDKDFDLARSRMMLLEHHNIPELQDKCPINLYE